MTIETKNIIKQTCLTYGIEPEKINQRCRNKKFIECKRQIAYRLRKILNMYYKDIGIILGIEYQTVKHHIELVEQNTKIRQIARKRIQNRQKQEKKETEKNISKNKKMIEEILYMFPQKDKKWAIKVLIDAINWNPKV